MPVMRPRRWPPDVKAAVAAVLVVVAGIPVAEVSVDLPRTVTERIWLWTGALLVVLVLIAWLTVRPTLIVVRRRRHRRGKDLFGVPRVDGWVGRPELELVVRAITRTGKQAETFMVGLSGLGGFGKTMLAAKVCREEAVLRYFKGGVVWLTVGKDIAVADRIGLKVKALGGEDSSYTEAEEAGKALRDLLARRGRTLLVADDVWNSDDLEPLKIAAGTGRLLVTTHDASVLGGLDVERIEIGPVPESVGQDILRLGLPSAPDELNRELHRLSGGWPLLLGLVNRQLRDDVNRRDASIEAAARDAIKRLGRDGPAALDVTNSDSRKQAIAGAINYSLAALDAVNEVRFLELGVFAETAAISVKVVEQLWEGTGGLKSGQTESLCGQLDRLSLISLRFAGSTGDVVKEVMLHDVIRRFTRSQLTPPQERHAHAALVKYLRSRAGAVAPGGDTAWWRLEPDGDDDYLWRYLTYHMKGAELIKEIDWLCSDLRFAAVRLRHAGPAWAESDLARSNALTATMLRRAIAQDAHLLGRTDPACALVATLTTRLGQAPELADQLPALRSALHSWTAWPDWKMPDQPPDALTRTLGGHAASVEAVTISRDGNWLATGSRDQTVKIWDAKSGALRTTLSGHADRVTAVAFSPDGTWLASTSRDRTVIIWDLATEERRCCLAGHQGWVSDVAISRDGTWLATTSHDRTARIWDAATGAQLHSLAEHAGSVTAVAISPDGTWLVTASSDQTARIWDAATGELRSNLPGHYRWVTAVAISPDGTWLVTGADDGIVQTWAVSAGPTPTVRRRHHAAVTGLVISPDGRWLVATGNDGTASIWEAATNTPRAVIACHDDSVSDVEFAPDSTWFATASNDGTTRIWDATVASRKESLGHVDCVTAVAVEPKGNWIATAGDDEKTRIWNADKGTLRTFLADGYSRVTALAISPDGTWLATGSSDGTTRIWDAATSTMRAVLKKHDGSLTAVAIYPGPAGGWFATACTKGVVRIWRSATRERLRTIQCHDSRITSLAVCPVNGWLVTGGADGTAKIWQADDGSCVKTLAGHEGQVTAVAVSPDGSRLVTGSKDGMARIWQADTGSLLNVLAGHKSPVTAVAISPDGNWLATSSEDRSLRIWSSATPQCETVTAIRTDANLADCAWFPEGLRLCAGGRRGIYVLSLAPPSASETKV